MSALPCQRTDRMGRARARNGRRELPVSGFLPGEILLEVHLLESLTFVTEVQDTIIKNVGTALRMFFRQPGQSATKLIADIGHRLPPSRDFVEILFFAHTERHSAINTE